MTTFAAFITRLAISLNDEGAATWDTEMLATFLNDAIRDYSNHFPLEETDPVSLTTGTAEYDLAKGKIPMEIANSRQATAIEFFEPNRSAAGPKLNLPRIMAPMTKLQA